VIGVWRIALTRGFLLPPIPEFLPPHGNIMVGAFLGTLIIFERKLALPIKWLLWVPFLWALSSLTVHLNFKLVLSGGQLGLEFLAVLCSAQIKNSSF
jgi:hypothetical protein